MYFYVDPNQSFVFTTDNKYWIERIKAEAKEHPDEVEILSLPSTPNGCISARVPMKFMDIREEQIVAQDFADNQKEILNLNEIGEYDGEQRSVTYSSPVS